jgi:DNA-binding transcriptional ArsR family regulator
VGPTNLAFHLKELSTAGLVTQAQVGRFVFYRAAYGRMNELLAYLTESCCAGPARVSAAQTTDPCGSC